jgi:hypothetical protein
MLPTNFATFPFLNQTEHKENDDDQTMRELKFREMHLGGAILSGSVTTVVSIRRRKRRRVK